MDRERVQQCLDVVAATRPVGRRARCGRRPTMYPSGCWRAGVHTRDAGRHSLTASERHLASTQTQRVRGRQRNTKRGPGNRARRGEFQPTHPAPSWAAAESCDAKGCSNGETVPALLHEQARLGARHCPEVAIVLIEGRSARCRLRPAQTSMRSNASRAETMEMLYPTASIISISRLSKSFTSSDRSMPLASALAAR